MSKPDATAPLSSLFRDPVLAAAFARDGEVLASRRDPAAKEAMLNELIDLAVLSGAVFVVKPTEWGLELGMIDGIDGLPPRTSQIAMALESATGGIWPLCRRLLRERVIAAGGWLSAESTNASGPLRPDDWLKIVQGMWCIQTN